MSKRGHPLYDLWRAMVARCHKPTASGFKNYGGRGISVCVEWRADFWRFVADIPPRPSKAHTLDRIENDGGYEPGNIRWATKAEQRRNSRQSPVIVVGERSGTLSDWATAIDLPRSTLFNRLNRGMGVARAVTQPTQSRSPAGTVFPPGGHAVCRALGLNARTVQSRLRRGWDFQRAISAPIRHEHASR